MKTFETSKEIGRKTRERFGIIGGLARILFGKKRVVIEKGKGAYSIYAFKNDKI